MSNQAHPFHSMQLRAPTGSVMVGNCNMDSVIVENLKYSRLAAEANEYSSFVRKAALRIFLANPEKMLASDAVKRAEELADELEDQQYFRIYFSENIDLLD